MMLKTLSEGAKLSPLALLLNPTFWLVICVWTAFIGFYAADLGAERERLKQTEITARALEKQSEANEKVLAAERRLRTDNLKAFDTYRQEQAHADQARDQLLTDLRRDNLRLRIPVRNPVRPAAHDADRPAPEGTEREGFSEPAIEFSEHVVGLLTRGDTAIRKHALVVDAYERLRLACTAPPDQPTPPTTTE